MHKAFEQLADVLFIILRQQLPPSVSTALKNPCGEMAVYCGFVVNGITSKQQLSAGMKCARASDSPFWPSPGEFFKWCKRDDRGAVCFPDDDKIHGMVMKYCARQGLNDIHGRLTWITGWSLASAA